jgi:hypothetical protein
MSNHGKYIGILSKFSSQHDSELSTLADEFESSTGLFIIKEHVKVSNFWTVSGKYLIVDSGRNILFKTDISVSSLETFLRTFDLIRNNFQKV